MRHLALMLLAIYTSANAAALDKEDAIKKRVQLQIARVQAQYCDGEFNKLETQTQTPFMLDQTNPANTNKRFSENKLSLEEEIGYKEFSDYCAVTFATLDSLSSELKAK